jgi:hypothetical protein
MKVRSQDPPRAFAVGKESSITVRHCADVELEPDEQVTFVSSSGSEYDVVRKSWGYYAAGSLNGRVREHGLRAALVANAQGRLYLLLVERGSEADFRDYLAREEQRLLGWLDDERIAARLEQAFGDQHQRPESGAHG